MKSFGANKSGASTLLNAGKTTNFVYQIEKSILKDDQIQEINEVASRCKIKDRIIMEH